MEVFDRHTKPPMRRICLFISGVSLMLGGCSWIIDERGLAGALAIVLEPIAPLMAATAEYKNHEGHWPDNASALSAFCDEHDVAFDQTDFECIALNPNPDGSLRIDYQLKGDLLSMNGGDLRGSVSLE